MARSAHVKKATLLPEGFGRPAAQSGLEKGSISLDEQTLPPSADTPRQSRRPAECWTALPTIKDSTGSYIKPESTVKSWNDFSDAVPVRLAENLASFRLRRGVESVTPLQSVAIPLLLEGKSAAVFGPTGCGKTLCYLLPLIARVLGTQQLRELAFKSADEQKSEQLAAVAESHEQSSSTCKFCGLNMAVVRVCPETGAVHPPTADSFDVAQRMYDSDHERVLETAAALKSNREQYMHLVAPRVIIVAPTYLLAKQIHGVARELNGSLKVGLLVNEGENADARLQVDKSLEGAEVVVANLETLCARMARKKIQFTNLHAIVFDEAEMLLRSPHFELLQKVVRVVRNIRRQQTERQRSQWEAKGTPSSRASEVATQPVQMVMVGAVLPERLRQLIQTILGKGHVVVSSDQGSAASDSIVSSIEHKVFLVAHVEKTDKIKQLYDDGVLSPHRRVIIFVNARSTVSFLVSELTQALSDHDVSIGFLTAQTEREQQTAMLRRFDTGACRILICTDIASNGLDFHNVDAVINYDFPTDSTRFLHRCGRCGRHGQRGLAITLFQPEDMAHAKALVRMLRQRSQPVPPKLTQYAKMNVADIMRYERARGTARPGTPEYRKPLLAPLDPVYPPKSAWTANQHRTPTS
jgi:superfamily II DNA/RNA helicase